MALISPATLNAAIKLAQSLVHLLRNSDDFSREERTKIQQSIDILSRDMSRSQNQVVEILKDLESKFISDSVSLENIVQSAAIEQEKRVNEMAKEFAQFKLDVETQLDSETSKKLESEHDQQTETQQSRQNELESELDQYVMELMDHVLQVLVERSARKSRRANKKENERCDNDTIPFANNSDYFVHSIQQDAMQYGSMHAMQYGSVHYDPSLPHNGIPYVNPYNQNSERYCGSSSQYNHFNNGSAYSNVSMQYDQIHDPSSQCNGAAYFNPSAHYDLYMRNNYPSSMPYNSYQSSSAQNSYYCMFGYNSNMDGNYYSTYTNCYGCDPYAGSVKEPKNASADHKSADRNNVSLERSSKKSWCGNARNVESLGNRFYKQNNINNKKVCKNVNKSKV